ncbi:heavy-metal-associated domain-containing protein [Candidatus Woesearchaeota archaeon]|nr:heavy-metal-associated domain-containing protein [Candidatus Woesearchaeota archaeon]
MKTITFKVTGMHCKSCEMLITDALEEAGVSSAKVDSKIGMAVIEFDEKKIKIEKIKKVIETEGYKVQ